MVAALRNFAPRPLRRCLWGMFSRPHGRSNACLSRRSGCFELAASARAISANAMTKIAAIHGVSAEKTESRNTADCGAGRGGVLPYSAWLIAIVTNY